MTGWRFAEPWWLLLVLPAGWAVVAAVRRERQQSVLYSSSVLLTGLPRTLAQRVQRWLPWARLLGMLLILLAVARPQAGLRKVRSTVDGIAMIMCLDRSGSMEALDFDLNGERVNRLTVVKEIFRGFVAGNEELPGRSQDWIGLVTFGGFAECLAPLTLDHNALLSVLETVQIPQPVYDSAGRVVQERWLQEEQATAIGDGVALAVDRLRQSRAKSKVIILLSDGENTAGVIEPEAAADIASELGIKIYTIGIGTTGRVPFPVVDERGRRVVTSTLVRLDEATLRTLAERTGGAYFHAQNTRTLSQVYAAIDRLEKSSLEGAYYSEYQELYAWLLTPAVLCILGVVVLESTWLRSWP